jgi:hypothetical protein
MMDSDAIWNLAHMMYSNTPPDGKDAQQSRADASTQKLLSERRNVVFQEVHAVTGGHQSGSLKGTVVTWDDSGKLAEGRQDEGAECRNRKMLKVHSLSTIKATDRSPRVVQRHRNNLPGRLIRYAVQCNGSRSYSLTHGERSPCASIPDSSLNYKARPYRTPTYIEPYPDIRNRSFVLDSHDSACLGALAPSVAEDGSASGA